MRIPKLIKLLFEVVVDCRAAEVVQRNVRDVAGKLALLEAPVRRQLERGPILRTIAREVVYDLLFRASAATLLEIAADPKHLGAASLSPVSSSLSASANWCFLEA
jgi:hypothetical protein